jgi:hypothetical protein
MAPVKAVKNVRTEMVFIAEVEVCIQRYLNVETTLMPRRNVFQRNCKNEMALCVCCDNI